MGYRPTIICGELRHEFGKFYGYVNLSNLLSIEFLKNNHKINDEEIFNYSLYTEIEFTADEFREFIDLYEKDINNYDFSYHHINYGNEPFILAEKWDKFTEIYNNNESKKIEWS